jgi:hypothetical protein
VTKELLKTVYILTATAMAENSGYYEVEVGGERLLINKHINNHTNIAYWQPPSRKDTLQGCRGTLKSSCNDFSVSLWGNQTRLQSIHLLAVVSKRPLVLLYCYVNTGLRV